MVGHGFCVVCACFAVCLVFVLCRVSVLPGWVSGGFWGCKLCGFVLVPLGSVYGLFCVLLYGAVFLDCLCFLGVCFAFIVGCWLRVFVCFIGVWACFSVVCVVLFWGFGVVWGLWFEMCAKISWLKCVFCVFRCFLVLRLCLFHRLLGLFFGCVCGLVLGFWGVWCLWFEMRAKISWLKCVFYFWVCFLVSCFCLVQRLLGGFPGVCGLVFGLLWSAGLLARSVRP